MAVAGLFEEERLERVFKAWRRAIRVDPILGRVAMPDLHPFADAFNLALTGDDETDALMASCSELLNQDLDPNIVIRVTTFLAETFVDEAGTDSGAETMSLVSTLGRVCGLLADEMVAEMSELARRDPLTALRNRLAWDEHLNAVGQRRITIALVDLNKFKQINDSIGHEEGDRVLTAFAADLIEAVDPALAFRIGGDEFAVAIIDGSDRDLEEPLSELKGRERISDFSYGVASTSEHHVHPRDVAKRADDLMYEMKHGPAPAQTPD
jgi:diguanylate cyclase (GGDEF)-like protein